MPLRIGEWFPGALHADQRLEVTGQWEGDATGGRCLTVDSLTDLDTRATAVLGIQPITVLYPLDQEPTTEVLPGQQVSTWEALAWFTGEIRPDQAPAEDSLRHTLDAFREHADAVTTALISTQLAQQRRQKANVTLDLRRRQSTDLGMLASSGHGSLTTTQRATCIRICVLWTLRGRR